MIFWNLFVLQVKLIKVWKHKKTHIYTFFGRFLKTEKADLRNLKFCVFFCSWLLFERKKNPSKMLKSPSLSVSCVTPWLKLWLPAGGTPSDLTRPHLSGSLNAASWTGLLTHLFDFPLRLSRSVCPARSVWGRNWKYTEPSSKGYYVVSILQRWNSKFKVWVHKHSLPKPS